ERAFDAARTMARTFESIAVDPAQGGVPPAQRRALLNSILHNVLEQNPSFNGTYSAWEPDAVDGADHAFAGRTETGTDTTGRFLSYWTRDDKGHVALQPLVEYDSAERHPNGVVKGGWYLGPRAGNGESILDPLPYIVQGKNVYLATMSVPIMVGGKFLGVAGADFDLDSVQKLAERVAQGVYDGKSKVTIVSNMGLVVASNERPDLVGQRFDVLDPHAEEDLARIKAGQAWVTVNRAADEIQVLSPIAIGRTKTPWSVLVSVPRSVALAQADRLGHTLGERRERDVLLMMMIGLAVAGIGIAATWFVARRIALPLRASASFAAGIAAGRRDQVLKVSTVDETGQLAEALRKMAAELAAGEARRVALEAEAAEARKSMSIEDLD
ncbi:MAG: HAMP domain-containing protein, partial [Rhodospirillales bacterium]|nr:HAMP domain-containing protein [Rhodospirillales bacterium]